MWDGLHLVDGRGCVEEANELVQGYNARVEAQLDALRPELPGADIVFCDVYKGVMEMITNPSAIGKKSPYANTNGFRMKSNYYTGHVMKARHNGSCLHERGLHAT
ncbi:unnamed protein product [Triticum turgidum subsp. durum]|uniref:GDSL esterase/lipase n=1 Tax=Triticum turgidum subsp. durum TaxID=4567 RepID=A0A9R0TL18_TRITD|nr:unnamed protein product [Triticum turgidum subsp. durum]